MNQDNNNYNINSNSNNNNPLKKFVTKTSFKSNKSSNTNNTKQNEASKSVVNADIREQIISMVCATIKKKASVFGYGTDILNALQEININPSKYLNVCIQCLSKNVRNITDVQLINGYLLFMNEFVNLIKKENEEHLNDYLQMISNHLRYEKYNANEIICKYGDKGKKAFVVLQGDIDILIKKNKYVNITDNDYLKYISNLLMYQEFGLLHLVLKDNFDLFPIEITSYKDKYGREPENDDIALVEFPQKENPSYAFVWKASESKNKERTQIFTPMELINLIDKDFMNIHKGKEKEKINYVSSNDYIQRLEVYTNIKESDIHSSQYISYKILKDVNIYSYVKIITKTQGSLIGEIALSDPLAQRSATMITKTECHLGTIDKVSYNQSIKSCAEKQRKQNVQFIQTFGLFSQIPSFILGKRYFNNFICEKIEKNAIIIKEGLINPNIYLLKEGEYESSIYGSLHDLVELKNKYAERICKLTGQFYEQNSVSRIREKIYYNNLMRDNLQFEEEFYTKRRMIIGRITSPELVGLKDYKEDNGMCLFTVKLKSAKGEMYQLSQHFYIEMKKNDKTVEANDYNLTYNRLEKMQNRLALIIKSKIESFYDYKSKRKKFQLEKQIKEDCERKICETAKAKIAVRTKNTIIEDKYYKINNDLYSNKDQFKTINTTSRVVFSPLSKNTTDIKQVMHNSHIKNQKKYINLKYESINEHHKRSRNSMVKKRCTNQQTQTMFSNIYIKSTTNEKPLRKKKKVQTLDVFELSEDYNNNNNIKSLFINSQIHLRRISASLSKKENTLTSINWKTQTEIKNSKNISIMGKKLSSKPFKPKKDMIEIEEYTKIKKDKYIHNRQLYLKNHVKKLSFRLQSASFQRKPAKGNSKLNW